MPETRDLNPFAIPEPYYLPGYTGHCPKYNYTIGQTYGRATHDLMLEFPSPRLKSTGPIREEEHESVALEDLEILRRRALEGRELLRENIAPGYKGHVPRAKQMVGLNFNRSCVKGVAEFEKRRKLLEALLQIEAEEESKKRS